MRNRSSGLIEPCQMFRRAVDSTTDRMWTGDSVLAIVSGSIGICGAVASVQLVVRGAEACGQRAQPAGRPLRQPPRLLGATVEDLEAVDGVGDARARGVREGL